MLWTTVDSDRSSNGATEVSQLGVASSDSETGSSEETPSNTSATVHGLMTGAIQLDMTRPVVVHVVKKTSSTISSSQPTQFPESLDGHNNQSQDLPNHTASTTSTENLRAKAHSRQSSNVQASQSPSEDRNGFAADVTVVDYLTELENDHAKIGNRDDRCRFFSVCTPSSSATSASFGSVSGGTSPSIEIAQINHWIEKSYVAILSAWEIAHINESATKSKIGDSISPSEAGMKSPRSMQQQDDGDGKDKTVSVGLTTIPSPIIPPPPPPPEVSRSSSSTNKGRAMRGIVSLEHTPANEVRSLAHPHPNMILPLKVVEGPEHLFILFPYHRYSLETVFRFSPGVLDSEAKKTFIAYQLLRTLQWLHDSDMVHGDLRPHNMKLTERLWLMLSGALFSSSSGSPFSKMISTTAPTSAAPTRPSSRRNSTRITDGNIFVSHSRANSVSSNGFASRFAESSLRIPLVQPVPLHIERTLATADWVEGRMSNFDYLMKLNEWAGRRSGDPNFHPVMPWVIDFSTPTSWRDLTKTKFRLNKGDEQLDFTYANPIPLTMSQGGKTVRVDASSSRSSYGPRSEQTSAPYHINDTLTELTYYNYFARRTPLCLLRKYVRSNFVAAEYPSSMERLYQWSPDECIPEFYADSSIFESLNPELPDLAVPSWAGHDARKFLAQHRDALESEHVSRYLHHWIDLTFGHKLSGEAGKQAKNVALMDRNSHRNHGFVQLFVMPHPVRRRIAVLSSSNKSASITWTIPREAANIPAIPQLANPPATLIGSASGITSSFSSSGFPQTYDAALATSSSSRDRRKTTRPVSVMYPPNNSPPQSATSSTAATTTTQPGSVFSMLPRIIINRPVTSTSVSASGNEKSSNNTPFSSATAASVVVAAMASTQLASSAVAEADVTTTTNTITQTSNSSSGDIADEHNARIIRAGLHRHSSMEANVIGYNVEEKSTKNALQRSSSDLTSDRLTTTATTSSTSTSSSSLLLSSSSSTTTASTAPPNKAEDSPPVAAGVSVLVNNSPTQTPSTPVRSAIDHDIMVSPMSPQYGSGSSFSDETDTSSKEHSMFRFSGDAVPPPTPTLSPVSSSPLGDDLETYQAQSQQQQQQHAIQSVSSPTGLNQFLEPSVPPKASGKQLSLSTGVPMAFESPTRQSQTTTVTRTSLGPVPTSSAPSVPAARSSSSGGSPKDRAEKEKEKTSFRKEFMKIFGTISDAVSSDKKTGSSPHHGGAGHPLSNSTSPYNSSMTPPLLPTQQSPMHAADSKQDPRKSQHVRSPGGANLYDSFGSNASSSVHSSTTYSTTSSLSSQNPSLVNSDISLGESMLLEEELAPLSSSTIRQFGSIPADEGGPFQSSSTVSSATSTTTTTTTTTTLSTTSQARAPPKIPPYVEDLSTGEYQSRFLMQISMLEPIFTAPFANFEFPLSNDDGSMMSQSERQQLLLDRAKCSDLFSTGCIIFQLLSGTPLFNRDNIVQYLQGDGTWWWGSASQAIPRRFKALIFDLILAGRPYFLFALQSGVPLGYITKALSSTTTGEQQEGDTTDIDDPFDFGVTSVSATLQSLTSTNSSSAANNQQQQQQPPMSQPTIAMSDLGRFSDGVVERFLNDDLISSPTSMKVFPSYFELVYQFLARYHGTNSWKKRIKLALENISFLVNLPMSGLELILPDLLSFFDQQETVIDALALIEPLAIKMGRVLTISKLLGPIVGLYERMQQYQLQSQPQSSPGPATSSERTAANRHLELALELLAPRFVHTLLAKFGQSCFLKNIVGFLVNEIRSTRKEIGFAAGSALLRLVSVLSPPIYIRYILYPLLSQLNKTNTEVLSAVLVEVGARMGEDVIVRHHMEVIIPLLQIHIFNKDDSISLRTSTNLLRLISSLCGLLHPTKILSSMMTDHRCMFAVLLNPPTDKAVWDALLDCLSSIAGSLGLHLAIKYARPYVQQFFTLFGNANESSAGERQQHQQSTTKHDDISAGSEFKALYPTMVMTRFKDLLDIRSGGGNVSIQQALGPAMRIESYLMGPPTTTFTGPPPPTISTTSDDDPTPTSSTSSISSIGANPPTAAATTTTTTTTTTSTSSSSSSTSSTPITMTTTLAPSPKTITEKVPVLLSDSSSSDLSSSATSVTNHALAVPTTTVDASTTNSDEPTSSTIIVPRRLSSPVRPTSPTLSTLATPPIVDPSKDSPAVVLRLATANEDGHVADHMPNWLASMQGMVYTPIQTSSNSSSSRPTSTMIAPGTVSVPGTIPSSQPLPTTGVAVEKGPQKKALSLLGAPAGVSTSSGLGQTPWESSREYELAAAPAAIHSFGPALPSPSGAGWPPTMGPNQTWNFSGQIGHTFKEHSNAIRCVCIHDNERLFLSGSKDTTVKCWDMLSDGASRQTYTGHRFAISHAEFVDRGNLVASCDGSVHVWELERGTRLANMDAASISSYASNSSRDPSSPNSTVFTCFTSHQDGRVLVCGTSLSTVTFTDLRAEQEVVCEWFLPSSATAPSSYNAASLVGSSATATNPQVVSTYPRSISLGHLDQNLMVVGQSSGHVTLIDIRSGLLLHNWRAHDGPITSLKSIPDAPGYLVSASIDKTISLWDVANANNSSPAPISHFRGHSDPHISFDIYRGNMYSIAGHKISISPLFGQPHNVVLEKRRLIKTGALKLVNQLMSFNILQSQHLALVGGDDGTIKVLQ
jgi:hypothetical protein